MPTRIGAANVGAREIVDAETARILRDAWLNDVPAGVRRRALTAYGRAAAAMVARGAKIDLAV